MNLNDTQKTQLQQWIDEGLKLSEIQDRIWREWGQRLTYMEARLLMDDLQLAPKDAEPSSNLQETLAGSPEPEAAAEETEPSGHSGQAMFSPDQPTQPLGDVSVQVDQVTRAGALVSGQVTFSDGQRAAWYLDQYGRLGIAPQQQGYKPSQADLMIFEGELRSQLSRMGYA